MLAQSGMQGPMSFRFNVGTRSVLRGLQGIEILWWTTGFLPCPSWTSNVAERGLRSPSLPRPKPYSTGRIAKQNSLSAQRQNGGHKLWPFILKIPACPERIAFQVPGIPKMSLPEVYGNSQVLTRIPRRLLTPQPLTCKPPTKHPCGRGLRGSWTAHARVSCPSKWSWQNAVLETKGFLRTPPPYPAPPNSKTVLNT